MKCKTEKGYTGIDIAISVVVLFIFVSLIAFLSYGFNSSAKEIELKSEATAIAVQEIENLKNTLTFEQIKDRRLNDEENNHTEEIMEDGKGSGFYKTIIIADYADSHENKVPDLVKKVTVKIQYRFKGEDQTVELSTIFSKES